MREKNNREQTEAAMTRPPSDRLWARADLSCNFNLASGSKVPDMIERSWYFEIPSSADTSRHWQELISRIIYDLNVMICRVEPCDAAWVEIEDLKIAPLVPLEILERDQKSATPPWVDRDKNRSWEPAVCFFVNERGAYDTMSCHDFTELLLYRLLHTQRIDANQFIEYLNHYFADRWPGAGDLIYEDAEIRFANLVTIRESRRVFRKAPGTEPYRCGPVDLSHV